MDTPPKPTFTDPDLQHAFSVDGFVVVDLLSADDLLSLARTYAAHDDVIKSLPFSVTTMSEDVEYRRRVDAEIRATLAPPLERLLNEYRFSHGGYFVKRPNEKDADILLHQDPSFVDGQCHLPVVFWAPLSAVGPGTGCLRVVPGSHRLNPGARGAYSAFPYPELESVIHERYLADVPMRPGQACLFNPSLFHASGPHNGLRERVVAGALLVPRESAAVYYYQDANAATNELEKYHVPDDFYLHHRFGRQPAEFGPPEIVAEAPARVSIVTLARECEPCRRS